MSQDNNSGPKIWHALTGDVIEQLLRANSGAIRLEMPSLNHVNLNSGIVKLIDPRIEAVDESACLAAWADAQTEFVPLPVLGGRSAEGFLMTGRILGSPDEDGYPTPGATLLIIESPNGAWVLTVGFARRETDSADLWRILVQSGDKVADRLERPPLPWVGQYISSGDGVRGMPRLLPEIEEAEGVIVASLFRYYALIDFINANKIHGANQ